MDKSKLLREKYDKFKVQMVKKYINLFPVYLVTSDMCKEFENNGFVAFGKREAITTTLNNVYFKLKEMKWKQSY